MIIKELNRNKIPKTIDNLVEVSKKIIHNMPETSRLAITLPLLGHIVSFKHIAVDEYNNGKNIKPFNIMVFSFVKSGGGKDRLKDFHLKHTLKTPYKIIDDYVKEYNAQRLSMLEEKLKSCPKGDNFHKGLIQNEILALRQVELVINSCTKEGFTSDAEVISQMPKGSIIVFDGEVGITLTSKDEKSKNVIDCLIQAFDGKLPSKSTKKENIKRDKVINIIVNSLMFSDPEFLKDYNTSKLFKRIMETGMIRRAFITYQENLIRTIIENPDEEYELIRQAYKESEIIDEQITKMFMKIPDNAVYVLPKGVLLKTFAPYKKELTEKFNATKNSLERKEILSRELKALKMATFCACLNHPNELVINDIDFEQGIYITEFLSQDYTNFLDFASPYNDFYARVFKFLLENLNKTFYKTTLINAHKTIEISRRYFRSNFIDILEGVSEMAQMYGYELKVDKSYNDNETYKLVKILTPEEIAELNKRLEVDVI